jgi:hypothetical protein
MRWLHANISTICIRYTPSPRRRNSGTIWISHLRAVLSPLRAEGHLRVGRTHTYALQPVSSMTKRK